MPGPPPKPADVRQRRNTRPTLTLLPGKHAPIKPPRPPAGLLPSSRKAWAAYWRSSVAQVAQNVDLGALERWIRAVDEYERCLPVLTQHRLVNGSMGQPVLNPLAAYLAEVGRTIAHHEQAFGLTPLARLRLGIAYGQAKLTAADLA